MAYDLSSILGTRSDSVDRAQQVARLYGDDDRTPAQVAADRAAAEVRFAQGLADALRPLLSLHSPDARLMADTQALVADLDAAAGR